MLRYGELNIYPLPEGRFAVGADRHFVPREEDEPLARGVVSVAITPFLIELPSDLLLLDAGLGEYAAGRDVSFLVDRIRSAGFEREHVTRVVLSHLHVDHCGGAVFNAGAHDQPTFPNAVYTCQSGELDTPEYTGASREARQRVIRALEAAGQLERFDGSGWLTADIELEHTGGHTRHHQIVRIHTGGRTVVFGGDVLPAPGQVSRSFRAKYDVEPERSQQLRRRIVQEAADHGHLLLFYHSASRPAAYAIEQRQGFQVEAAVEPHIG